MTATQEQAIAVAQRLHREVPATPATLSATVRYRALHPGGLHR